MSGSPCLVWGAPGAPPSPPTSGPSAKPPFHSSVFRLAPQRFGQEFSRMRRGDGGHRLRRAFGDDLAAGVAAFGPEVDDPVGALDDIEMMLDDQDGVAG